MAPKHVIVHQESSTKAPLHSWWTNPELQADRRAFAVRAEVETPRIIGSPRFGGAKRTHDKFTPKA